MPGDLGSRGLGAVSRDVTGLTAVLSIRPESAPKQTLLRHTSSTHVALLVGAERTAHARLRAVPRSVALLTAVVALHRRSLDTLVLALGRTVAGLLAVVADVASAGRGEAAGSAAARGAGGGDVAKAAARQKGRQSMFILSSVQSVLQRTRSCSKSCHRQSRRSGTHRHRPAGSFG